MGENRMTKGKDAETIARSTGWQKENVREGKNESKNMREEIVREEDRAKKTQ